METSGCEIYSHIAFYIAESRNLYVSAGRKAPLRGAVLFSPTVHTDFTSRLPSGERSRRPHAMAVFKGCVICKGKKRQPRNGRGGNTCSAGDCKRRYKEQRLQPSVAAVTNDAHEAADLPDDMYVDKIKEILGERCCEPFKLSHKKRKNGPGTEYSQQFLVRGNFLTDDGDADDGDEDEEPEPNTFWVNKEDLLETIDKVDVEEALRVRHEKVVADL